MSLQVEIPSGSEEARFDASEVVLERGLSQPVVWRVLLSLRQDDARLASLVDCFEGGQVTLKVLWDEAPLGPEGVAIGAYWSRDVAEHLVVEAHCTALKPAPSPAPDPDPFTPRWRVHHDARNLLKLAQKLKHVAVVPTWVQRSLEKIEFAPGDFTSVVQDGLSDWEFLLHILHQYGVLGADAALKPPVLTGSVEEAPGQWLVTWGSKAAYEKLNDISNREIDFTESDETKPEHGYESFLFGLEPFSQGRDASRCGLVAVSGHLRRKRKFSTAVWSEWTGRDLPLFTKEKQRFVYRVTDRLCFAQGAASTSTEARISWSTRMEVLPEGGVVAGPRADLNFRPWFRIGTVAEVTPNGPWIKVQLEGFEADYDCVQARLQSPYVGTDGKKGLHFVPEPETKVCLSWSGRVHEPVLVVGNVREEESEHPAPSVWIESLMTEQFADILVKEVGEATVESPLVLSVQKETTVTATGALKILGEDTFDMESAKAFKLTGKDSTQVTSTGDLSLGSDGGVTVSAGGDASIDASGAATLSAGGDAKMDASGNATISAGGDATVDATGNATVSATGEASISGATVNLN